MLFRYLVANARVFSEAVLYHGSLRFLAMNPAVLVLLWIRLSVTFGYPATLTELRTLTRVFHRLPQFATLSHTLPMQNDARRRLVSEPRFPTMTATDAATAITATTTATTTTTTAANTATVNTEVYNTIDDRNVYADASKTSPTFINFPFADTTTTTHAAAAATAATAAINDTHILSIVRVSSTSVVKPPGLRSAGRTPSTVTSVGDDDRFTSTVAAGDDSRSSVRLRRPNQTNANGNGPAFEQLVTPYVSLLRKNRLDIDDEGLPRERSNDGIATAAGTGAAATNVDDVHDQPPSPATYHVHYSRMAFDVPTNGGYPARSFPAASATTSRTTTTTTTTTTTFTPVETTTEMTETTFTEDVPYDSTVSDRQQRTDTSSSSSSPYDENDDHYDHEHHYTQPQVYGVPERVYGEPERVYGEPERVYGEPERVYGEPERVYGEPEKIYDRVDRRPTYDVLSSSSSSSLSSSLSSSSSTRRIVDHTPPSSAKQPFKADEYAHEQPETEENEFQLPDTSEMNSKTYSSFTTKINDKKSSYIVDNGTYRKYRVEEKTPDGFIVGEYGMVSHRDGSLRGVRYTADSNINPSLIYETLVKFLSLT